MGSERSKTSIQERRPYQSWEGRVFVISLARREDRRVAISARLSELGLTACFFDAFEAESAGAVLPGSALSGGEGGLLASLYTLLCDLEKTTEIGKQDWIMICEDDLVPSARILRFMKMLDSTSIQQNVLKAGHLLFELQPSLVGKIRTFARPRVRLRSIRYRYLKRSLFPQFVNHYRFAGSHLIFVKKDFAARFGEDLRRLDLPVDVGLNCLIEGNPRDYAATRKSFGRQSTSSSDIAVTRGALR